jgi:thiol-disulfide isomerase/thioredoxin
MKKISLLALCAMSICMLHAQVSFDALLLANKYPQQSQNLTFTFDQKMSPLKNEKNIDIAVYEFTSKGLKVKEPKLVKKGSSYTGTVMIDSNANAIAFGVSNGESKDNNGGKGYIVPVYTKSNEPVKGYYASAGQIYAGYGEYLFGMANEPQKSLDLLEEGVKKYPELKDDGGFYNSYLGTVSAAKKKDAEPVITEKLKAIENKPTLTESDYSLLSFWYGRFKNKSKVDSLTAVMKQKYPDGNWKSNELMSRFYKEKNTGKKVAMYDSILNILPADKLNADTKNQLKAQIANAYTAEKNTAGFMQWTNQLPAAAKYSNYNNVSWNMAEAGENMADAKKMSEEATVWAKQQVQQSTEKQPESMTAKQWEEQRKSDYAMYADTYAFILYNTGDYKTGLPYAKDGATFNKLKDPEYNERYAILLEKSGAPDAKSIIEGMVKDGKASAKSKDALKVIYVKGKGSEAGFDAYVAALEADAKMKKRAELAKTMINTASPKFALKDWEGKEVSLESLKGKIVVVDFWATWCGPCIASMPGMKKAQEKLAARDDVKFVFVDTWETVDNKNANSKDFMAKKKYPFYVLMDNEDKMVKDFEVSGIPTKFIIDKAGNIRFKAIGFEGNTDALADEVVDMVEMAGK